MSRLYLVTGFLGAGKTTFLKNFIRSFENQRLHIIVNEYGKEGIDGGKEYAGAAVCGNGF